MASRRDDAGEASGEKLKKSGLKASSKRFLEKLKRSLKDDSSAPMTWSGGASLKSVASGVPVENGGSDLEACINAIESLDVSGMTPEQQAAIRNLRAATSCGGKINDQPRTSLRNAARPWLSRRRDSFSTRAHMPKDLMKCFEDEDNNKEDTDQRKNVSAVLNFFEGPKFGLGFAPQSKNKVKSVPLQMKVPESDSAEQRVARESLVFADIKDTWASGINRRGSDRRNGAVNINPLDFDSSTVKLYDEDIIAGTVYCPPEWNALTIKARTELTSLLSWENISKWDFDVLVVTELSTQTLLPGKSQRCPLLFVGWAILCAPLAQQAMEGSLAEVACDGEVCATRTKSSKSGYDFVTNLKVSPESVSNFLREVERGYKSENPYHNNIHAADVTQTLHCLLQFMGDVGTIYDQVDFFSILLAATFHDVGHPGTNNLFQNKTRSNAAIQYNDVSTLENMHSFVGHSLLMGEKKRDEWDVFKNWDENDIRRARALMITAVLGTDMSHHFPTVGKLAALVEKARAGHKAKGGDQEAGDESQPILTILAQTLTGDEEDPQGKNNCMEFSKLLFEYVMHVADISNPTKKTKLCEYWADKALAEFFAQGDEERRIYDREKEMYESAMNKLPVESRVEFPEFAASPLCDRNEVKRADSQIGFLNFVVRPAFALLGDIVPRVADEVMPIIHQNINFWQREKSRISMQAMQSLAMKKSIAVALREGDAIGEEEEQEEKGKSDGDKK